MLTARIGVKDLERELRFYEALGFVIERWDGGARVSFQGAQFTLEPYEELRVRDAPLLDWEQHPPQFGAGIQLYVYVDDVDVIRDAIPVGVPQPYPVRNKSWGLRELPLKTPSGYVLTFAQPLERR